MTRRAHWSSACAHAYTAMPARVKSQHPPPPPQRSSPVPSRGIGKVVSTKDFHCVMARDYAVFYKVLVQLR